MDLEVKVLDFEQIYDEISSGEILTIFIYIDENTVKTEYIVKDKTGERLVLEDIKKNIEVVWDRTSFLENTYKILDIIRENRFLTDTLPNQVYSATLEDLQPKLINLEAQYVQKADYEQIFPIDEQIEVINQYYLSRLSNPSKFAYSNIQKKTQNLGDLIDNFKFIPKSTDNPILEQFEYGHFYSPLLRPIVFDSKYCFDDKFVEDPEDERNFMRSDEDIRILNDIVDLTSLYEKSGENSAGSNKITYNEFQEILIYGSKDLPIPLKKYEITETAEGNKIVKEKLVSYVEPLYSNYVPIYETDHETSLPGYKFRSNDFSDVYRYITPTNILNGISKDIRRIQGSKVVIYDRPDKTLIGEKAGCRECHGTAKTSESKYFNQADEYVPIRNGIKNNFNNSISKEPEEVFATRGEDLYIIGMYLQSPYTVQPTNNLLFKKNKYSDKTKIDYYIDNKNGLWNVLDRVIQSKQVNPKKQIVESTINLDLGVSSLDYFKDNIIYFNTPKSQKNLTRTRFIDQFSKIIPDNNQILSIEDRNIKNINNITDLNKILSKYFLSIKNLNIGQIKKIEEVLNNRYIGYRESNQKEKADYAYYKGLNLFIETVFGNIYRTLFSIDKTRNITILDISNLIVEYLKSYDKQLIDHILKFYFRLDVEYTQLSDGLDLFINQFYSRYTDYLYSDSPVRLLITPGFSIRDELIQKYADYIKRFYNFDKMRHNPSNIGLINELYHNMYVIDSNEHFNYFAEYVYATNGYYKIVEDERNLTRSYPDIEFVESLIQETNVALNREMIKYRLQHSRCLDYNLSKFYTSFNKLEEDNNRDDIPVDRIFDKTSTLNAIYSKNGENSLQKIKEVYPYETSQWYTDILEALKLKNGKLSGAYVVSGMWALLVDRDKYDLYERVDNKWTFKLNVPESCRVEVATYSNSKKSIVYNPPKSLAVLCNLEGNDATLVDEIAQLLNFGHEKVGKELKNTKCTAHDNTCLPKVLVAMYKDLELYKTVVKAIKYYKKQKEIYSDIAFEKRQKLESILIRSESENNKKIVKKVEKTEKVEIQNPQYKLFNTQWSLILNIPDTDVRYTEMEKFISNHGLFKRQLVDDVLKRVDNDDWSFIYYDILGVNNPLCCRHVVLQVKQAWKTNIERNKLQLLLESNFGVVNPELRYIYCKNCGETIGLNRESDMEGFDGEDNVIQIREAVYDFLEGDDDFSYLFKSSDQELQLNLYNNILSELKSILHFKLNRDAVIKIINNSAAMYNKEFINVFDFEYAIYMNNKKYFTPEVASFFSRPIKSTSSGRSFPFIDAYVDARNKVIVDKSLITEDLLQRLSIVKPGPDKVIKNTFGSFEGEVQPHTIIKFHLDYLSNIMVNSVVLNLLAYLINSDPEIKIQPSGERFSSCRISNVSNYILNQELLIETFSKILDCTAKGVSNRETVFYRYKDYYGTQLSSDLIKQILIDQFKTTFTGDQAYMIQHNQKEEKYRKELNIARLSLSESTSWKTFRPILKLGNVREEIDKINLDSIRRKIEDSSTTVIEFQYIAFQLSYYLFYSIQQIIQTEPMFAGQSFSNFCCLNTLKSNYIDFFAKKNSDIDLCIKLMAEIQPEAFYNPNQSSVLIIKNTIEIVPPKLLAYFNDARGLLNIKQLHERIRKLYRIYGLFEGEKGEKRLYSKFYDQYLAMVSSQTRQEITDKIRESNPQLGDIEINDRVDNLYNTSEPGLIQEDIVSGKYLWDIDDKINEIIKDKDHSELLDLYNQLLKKLYISVRIYISRKAYDPIKFKLEYQTLIERRSDLLEQYKNIFNEIKVEIDEFDGNDIYREFSDLNTRFQGVNIEDADIDSVFREFTNYVIPTIAGKKKPLEEVGIHFDLTKILSGCLSNHEERRDNLINQIQIEGYKDDEILGQFNIRKNAILLEYNYNSFDQLKRYYLIVAEAIFKFVNLSLRNDKYSFIGIDNHKKHKELSDEVNKAFSQNIHMRDYKFKDLIFENPIYKNISEEALAEMNKVVSFDTINKLLLVVNRFSSIDNSIIEQEIFKPAYIQFIIYYFIQKSLINFISVADNKDTHEFLLDYVNQFIIDELNRVVGLNCMTNKEVRNHLRELIKNQNDKRKNRVAHMTPSRKMQYQLYRANGLGEFFPGEEGGETDEYSAFGMNEPSEDAPIVSEMENIGADEITAGDVVANVRDSALNLQMTRHINADTEEVDDEILRGDDFE